jgi:hypothetical protein
MTVRREGELDGGLFYLVCEYKVFAADAFMRFMEDIAIKQNPAYKNSAKLSDMAADLQVLHEANILALRQYLRENKALHIEGYETFRMFDYKYKLDIMMYLLIKKMRTIEP